MHSVNLHVFVSEFCLMLYLVFIVFNSYILYVVDRQREEGRRVGDMTKSNEEKC